MLNKICQGYFGMLRVMLKMFVFLQFPSNSVYRLTIFGFYPISYITTNFLWPSSSIIVIIFLSLTFSQNGWPKPQHWLASGQTRSISTFVFVFIFFLSMFAKDQLTIAPRRDEIYKVPSHFSHQLHNYCKVWTSTGQKYLHTFIFSLQNLISFGFKRRDVTKYKKLVRPPLIKDWTLTSN